MSNRRLSLAFLILALISLWLRSGFPIEGIPGAMEDDGLFVSLARQIGAGEWLGLFDRRTLVKGMFYPLFILAAFIAGIPLKMAEQLLYLSVVWVVAWALMRRAGRPALALVVFALLALNPVMWTYPMSRVIREGVYIGLSLGVVGTLVLAGWARTSVARVAWGAIAGLLGGAFWLTREEGVWLLPSVLAVAGGVALDAWKRPHDGPTRVDLRPLWPASLARIAVPSVVAAAVFLLAISSVAELNRRHYGLFLTNEVKSYPFRHAYGALSRIIPDHWARYVVFPADARARAYAASPAARELSPTLDGVTGNFWREAGCRQVGVSDCPEILAGWFQWALREAVSDAGHYGSPAQAAAFYERLAREIDAACDRGDLACEPPRASLAPPFRWGYLADAARLVPTLASFVFQGEPGAVFTIPTVGSLDSQRRFGDLVGPLAPSVSDPLIAAGERRRALIQRIARPIAYGYAALMPVGAVLATLGILISLLRWRRREPSLLLLTLAAASIAAAVVRIVLLSYLEVTAIPSANILYASPATPFAILFVVLGCWLGAEAFRNPSRPSDRCRA